jgi:uncharacterized SAM-binding protein YcdF (DUF218 family)
MVIFLSKFLPLLVYPLGLACLLILAAIILHRRKKLQRSLLIFILVALWLGGNRWVADSLVRSLEWRHLPPPELNETQDDYLAEAIVLLAGGTLSAQYPRPIVEVNGAGDRVIYAAYLYQQGKAPLILLSGGRIDWMESGSSPAEDMASLLTMLQVPEKAMLLEDTSRNTSESAVAAWEMLSIKGIRKIILVTSAEHMPRSLALFEKQGFEVIPAPTDYSITQEEWERLTHPDLSTFLVNLLPEAGNLASTSTALKEYIGMLVSWLRGQI